MDLVARYLYAVGRRLPKAQRDDIVAELADDIASQIEDKQAQLGRLLDDNETAAILQAYGRPMIVAARYGAQQSLIGSALVPYYWNAVKIMLASVFAADIVVTIVRGLAKGDVFSALMKFGDFFWTTGLMAFSILTLVFLALELNSSKSAKNWNARSLPPIRETQPISRVEIIVEIAVSMLILTWLLDLPGMRHGMLTLILGRNLDGYQSSLWVGPSLHWFLIISVFYYAMILVQNAINLFYPSWKRLRWATRAVGNAVVALSLPFLLAGDQFIVAAQNAHPAAQSTAITHWLNVAVFYSLVCVCIGSAASCAFNVYQLIRSRRSQALRYSNHAVTEVRP